MANHFGSLVFTPLVKALQEAGLGCESPRGAYYVMTDISAFPFADDWAFAMYLVERLRPFVRV